ncbi:MAG: hypothetical protein F6K11_18965 [Leptolyngbya sp. SIO3F4]|nr:hypothetical protein [Leptolyngbya sp. SIO3F4]
MKAIINSILTGFIAITVVANLDIAKAQAFPREPKVFHMLEDIELSQDQQKEMTHIFQRSEAELSEILTPQQMDKYDEQIAAGIPRPIAIHNLNLSEEQKMALENLRFETLLALRNIATPEQRFQFRNNLRGHGRYHNPFANMSPQVDGYHHKSESAAFAEHMYNLADGHSNSGVIVYASMLGFFSLIVSLFAVLAVLRMRVTQDKTLVIEVQKATNSSSMNFEGSYQTPINTIVLPSEAIASSKATVID